MKRQAVIFIHGVGDQRDGYSVKMENALRKLFPKQMEDYRDSLPKAVRDSLGQIAAPDPIFREVLWASETSRPQNDLWRRSNRTHDLDMVKLRKFFVAFGGDAVAYQKDGEQDVVYNAIHHAVQEQVDSVKTEYPNDTFEFTFVCHSLGSVIASNYLYDQSRIKPASKAIRATNLFTLGSPIAIWTLRFGGPLAATSPVKVRRPNGAWINILDDEDVIGFPLRDLNPQYKAAVDMDYVTEVGGLISMGNPLSHVAYWTDKNVLNPISRKLAIDYLRIRHQIPYRKNAYLKYIRSLWNI